MLSTVTVVQHCAVTIAVAVVVWFGPPRASCRYRCCCLTLDTCSGEAAVFRKPVSATYLLASFQYSHMEGTDQSFRSVVITHRYYYYHGRRLACLLPPSSHRSHRLYPITIINRPLPWCRGGNRGSTHSRRPARSLHCTAALPPSDGTEC